MRAYVPFGYALDVRENAISLVDADPDLADAARPAELERARREALARVAAALARRVGRRGGARARRPTTAASSIVDGLLSREVDVLGRRCVELIGPCDVHAAVDAGTTRARTCRPRSAGRCSSRRRWPCSTTRWSQRIMPVAAARRRAVQPRHAARAPPRGRAGDRAPPARRGPAAAHALAPRRALGEGDAGRASSCRCRSATSGWRTSSAPTGRRSRRALGELTRGGRDQPPRRRRLAAARRAAGEAAPPQAGAAPDLGAAPECAVAAGGERRGVGGLQAPRIEPDHRRRRGRSGRRGQIVAGS